MGKRHTEVKRTAHPKKANITEPQKLQKVLAAGGHGSRREIEKWIEQSRIKVNGKLAHIGQRVTYRDRITVDGRGVTLREPDTTNTKLLMYHKPEGEVCTMSDPQGRPTVFTQLPHQRGQRWVMVGRLDINTSGLLLFTNKGELAERLMHPSYEQERRYAVRVLGNVTAEHIKALETGVELDDGPAQFDSIEFAGGEGANRWYHVTLHEGRNRIVRRLFESQHLKVSRLIRIAYAGIELPRDLRMGKHRNVDPKLYVEI